MKRTTMEFYRIVEANFTQAEYKDYADLARGAFFAALLHKAEPEKEFVSLWHANVPVDEEALWDGKQYPSEPGLNA